MDNSLPPSFKKREEELKKLITNGESETVEFKSAAKGVPQSMFETICAFLNRNGGIILLGVNDDKEVTGINPEKAETFCKEIVNLSNNPQKLFPSFLLKAEVIEFDGKIIIYVYVPQSSQVHKCNGKVYDRSADGDFVVISDEMIKNMYIRKSSFYSETTIYPYLIEDYFVPGIVKKTRELIKRNRPNHPWNELSDKDFFVSSGLYRKDISSGKEGFTLAALLLFGKEEYIISAIPHYKTDAIVRKVDLNRYDDRITLRCNLIESLDKLMDFIEKHLPDKFYLEGITRISLRDIIFREIIVNFLIHREFTNGYPATLIIKSDHIETKNANKPHNYGKLIPGNFEPFPKNPNISKIFTQMGHSEELGTGIRNVYDYIEQYSGSTNVDFSEKDVFIVKVPLNDGTLDGTLDDAAQKTAQKTVEKTVEKILDIIKKKPEITQDQIAEIVGISRRGIEWNLKKLKESGILKRVGGRKTGHWEIIENKEEK